MKGVVIVSKKDTAGMNIGEELEKLRIKPYYKEEDSINCENIDKEIDADFYIFATKHQSKEGKPSLSVHCPGNFDKAELGGKERELCVSMPKLMRRAFLLLNEKDIGKHLVVMEVTHHGPYLEKPCMFIEIGSCDEDWKNKELGKIVASVIFEILNYKDEKCGVAIGIGDTHYCAGFSKLIDKIAFGHICPKYNLVNLDSELLEQMISRNFDKVDYAVLNWKGLGKEKERIIKILDEKKISWKRSDKI